MKRCHPQMNRSKAAIFSRPSPSNTILMERQERGDDTDEPLSPESVASGDGFEGRSENLVLVERLERLLRLRAGIDADIQAVKRTMEICKE